MEWVPAGLDRALKREFGYSARALPTPALTGIRLWGLTRDPADYPVLPDEERLLLYRGQARSEFCALPSPRTLEAIYEYDARWAYVAACTGLVCGTMVHDSEDRYEPRMRGFYRVEFTPPRDWGHLGLLMVARARVHDGWWYPTAGTHETWAGWTELLLARDYGWRFIIRERLLWACDRPAPLDRWRDKLLRIAGREPGLAGAIRDIIIRTIGQLHAQYRRRAVIVPDAAAIPEQFVLTADRLPDGQWRYIETGPLSAHLAAMRHPEWSSDIYARTRTRMLRYQVKRRGEVVRETGALTVPRADVLAIRTDGLWLARDPRWPDTGEMGEMRLRGMVRGPVAAPRTPLEIRDLRARMERVAD